MLDANFSAGGAAVKLSPNNTSVHTLLGNDRLFQISTGSVACKLAFYDSAAGVTSATGADFLLPANTIQKWNTGPTWNSIAVFAASSTNVFVLPLSRN